MSGMRRPGSILVLVALATALFALPALGQEEEEDPAPATDEQVEPAPIDADLEPAVPVDDSSEAPAALDWTYRYMIPLGVVLALLIAVATSIQYFTRVVRRRYRIVEE